MNGKTLNRLIFLDTYIHYASGHRCIMNYIKVVATLSLVIQRQQEMNLACTFVNHTMLVTGYTGCGNACRRSLHIVWSCN